MTAAWILARLVDGKSVPGRHVVVVAHPDDEAIAFGGALCCLDDVAIVQLTNDTPSREAERAAAQVAGGWQIPVSCGGARFRHAHESASWLLDLLGVALLGADVVWTHPYEGGHLDHDTAAWLVQTACGRHPGPLRMEFASYHMTARGQSFGEFWPDPSSPAVTVPLDPARLRRKLAALAAYSSQTHILRKFPAPSREAYRPAPVYDFSKPSPPPRSRWDVKGYLPPTSAWRAAIAAAGRAA